MSDIQKDVIISDLRAQMSAMHTSLATAREELVDANKEKITRITIMNEQGIEIGRLIGKLAKANTKIDRLCEALDKTLDEAVHVKPGITGDEYLEYRALVKEIKDNK